MTVVDNSAALSRPYDRVRPLIDHGNTHARLLPIMRRTILRG